MFDEAMQALEQGTIKGSEHFLNVGAQITSADHVAFDHLYRLELLNATYDKILVGASGRFWVHNAPVSTLLGTEDFKLWEIRDADGKQVFVAHAANAVYENNWWANIRKVLNDMQSVPKLYGDVVVFRYQRPITWTMKELQREMMAFVVQRYGNNNTQYKFSP